MSFPPNRQRLAELYGGAAASESEVRVMAEELDNRRRRDGDKTLRDEFAMAALALTPRGHVAKFCATEAYAVAEAMLDARSFARELRDEQTPNLTKE